MEVIRGYFTFGSPFIDLMINSHKIPFLLDTGFNGHVMLSENIIEKLGLVQIGFTDFKTASGEEKMTEVYKAKLKFFNKEIEVPVLSTSANFCLAGIELFHNYRIIIERHTDTIEIIRAE